MNKKKSQTDKMFSIRRSPIQGTGAFAKQRIRKGTQIIEYTGKRITPEEQDSLYDDDKMERHHTFLFYVDENTTIDGSRGNNQSRYINHSCDPNCVSLTDDGRVFIEALRNIQPGVELTYDYAYIRTGRYKKEWDTLYACSCGSANCRGTIMWRPKKKKKKKAKTKAKAV
ncbi:MAG: SET domain-containing protein-lysine N-methyltransferase [candidate division Zixibacteria bacterium]|nr:SET domain-containing protein-lysine N-methyltransferase [candidate division Zixibacteria bacterium]